MNEADNPSRLLIGTVLHELATDTEALLLIASALDDQTTGISSNADPQKLREVAAIVKNAALQVGVAAANIVGAAERLRLVAEFSVVTNMCGGALPS